MSKQKDPFQTAMEQQLQHPNQAVAVYPANPAIQNVPYIADTFSAGSVPPVPNERTDYGRLCLLSARLRRPAQAMFHSIASAISGDKVFVFVVPKDGSESVTLEDSLGLFPSDRLITRLLILSN